MAVHRYKANESGSDKEAVETKKSTAKKAVPVSDNKKKAEPKSSTKKSEKSHDKRPGFLRRLKDYFVGSWRELRQVRWPNRKQTWALTVAVILFSLVLGIFIFLLDAGFTLLFKKFIF